MWSLALAIALVTAAGAAVYILSLGMVQSLEDTRDAYYDRSRFSDIFALMRRAPNSLVSEVEIIPGVQQVSTRITYNIMLELPNYTEPINGVVTSMPAENALNQLHLREGRLLLPTDTDAVIVGEVFANAHHLHPGDNFTATLKGHKHTLKVVGTALSPEYIFFAVPGAVMPDNERFGVFWMSRKAMAAAFDFEGAFNDLVLTVAPGASESEVITRLDRLLQPYGCSGSYSRQDHMSHATLTGQIEQLRKSARIAAPIFLCLVAFMLHNLMKRHIATERELIGMMKATGFSDSVIAWHYAELMLLIVGAGVAVGVGLGAFAGRAAAGFYAGQFQFPFLEYHLSPRVLLGAALLQLAAGLLGAFQSLRAAARIEPAVAMRPPPPPVYRKTALESALSSLAADQIVRIIIRNILRWPARSLMTGLTIVGSMSLVIGPVAVMGSATHMADVHFHSAERQDLLTAFAYPRELTSLHSIRHYPGVMEIEPFRVTPVRIRFDRRERRVTVIAHASDTDLSRPIDNDNQPIILPEAGIVVPSALAHWLGANVGDMVTLTLLETNGGEVRVPIAALSNSYIGLTFFTIKMEKGILNRMLNEGDVMSGVSMKIDPDQQESLYTNLRNTPSVVAVVSQLSALRTMRRMFSANLRLTYINYIFASLILVGLVYNTGRISLSERQRELATLVMLGFSRNEAAFVIVGELLLIALLALPMGCVAGYAVAWLLTEGAASEAFRIPLFIRKAEFAYGVLAVSTAMLITGAALHRDLRRLDLVEMMKMRD